GEHRAVGFLRQVQGGDCPHFGPVLAEGVRLAVPQQVIAAESGRVDAHLPGYQVQHRLHGEGELWGAWGPCVTPRHLVGVDPIGHHPHGRDVITAGGPSAKVDRRTEGTVGPTVEDGVHVHGLQLAVTTHSHPHTDHRSVT